MKLKKFIAILASVAVAASMAITSFAADVIEITKEGTSIALDQAADGSTDDTTADLTMSWEDGKVIFKFVVVDPEIDNTNANIWEQDCVEVRVDGKNEIRVNAASGDFTVSGNDSYDVDWKLTDDGYEITVTYKNDAVTAGYSFTFAVQVAACTGGVRNCTLHFDSAHSTAWTNDSVRTSAVLTGDGISAGDVEIAAAPQPKTITMTDGGAVLFEGSGTSKDWGQAVSLAVADGSFNPDLLQPGCLIYVNYSGVTPEVVLQSFSGGTEWAKVAPSEDDGSIAIFTYDDMVAAYGDDFSALDVVHVGDTGGDITVTKVVLQAAVSADMIEAAAETDGDDDVAYTTVIAAISEPTDDTVTDTATADNTAAAAAGNTNAAAATSKGSADTGIEGVAVVAGLAVIAAGAVIVSKKRK